MMQRRTRTAARRGSFLVEAAIATALLATATFALTKLARSASDLSQHADQRLAATLAAENTLERFRGLSVAEIQSRAGAISESIEQASGCQVEIETTPLQSAGPSGLHIQVTAGVADHIRVTLHDWRLEEVEQSDAE